jgi:hypothetical protein
VPDEASIRSVAIRTTITRIPHAAASAATTSGQPSMRNPKIDSRPWGMPVAKKFSRITANALAKPKAAPAAIPNARPTNSVERWM